MPGLGVTTTKNRRIGPPATLQTWITRGCWSSQVWTWNGFIAYHSVEGWARCLKISKLQQSKYLWLKERRRSNFYDSTTPPSFRPSCNQLLSWRDVAQWGWGQVGELPWRETDRPFFSGRFHRESCTKGLKLLKLHQSFHYFLSDNKLFNCYQSTPAEECRSRALGIHCSDAMLKDFTLRNYLLTFITAAVYI